jgi:hypothetical protein
MSAAADARVALRIRSGLEAVDLGFAMARAWWRPLAASWAVLVLPLGVGIVVLLRDHPAWSLTMLWWLRPAFARVPLHVLGQALFGRAASVADTARALPQLLRSGLGTSLVAHRLLPSRTYYQPVLQLEGLRGRARRERCEALGRRDSGAATALVLTIAHLNGALISGLLLLVSLLTPREVQWNVFGLLLGDATIPTVLPALYLVGISVFEPLFVAGGFGLYVSRRVFLEGWEIELAFRRLAARRPGGASRHSFAAATAALLLLFAAANARADVKACRPDDPSSASACIREVRSSSDFGGVQKVTRWLPKQRERSKTEPLRLEWLAAIVEFVVRFARVVLWLGLAITVAVLLFSLRSGRWRREPDSVPDLPRTFLGLDLDPASLPPDVVAAARACWQRGERITALSLLYRGALVRLCERGALEIPESATEHECLHMVRRSQSSDAADAFDALTGSWVRTRYAHEPPGDAQFESLCASFAALEAHR